MICGMTNAQLLAGLPEADRLALAAGKLDTKYPLLKEIFVAARVDELANDAKKFVYGNPQVAPCGTRPLAIH